MTKPDASLRRFFAFVEQNGGGSVRRERLLEALGGDAALSTLEALGRARITSEGPLAEVIPCPELKRCALEVRELPPSKDPKVRLFITVCEADPRECETADIAIESLRQTAISIREIVQVVRGLVDVDPTAKLLKLTADEPMRIGEQEIRDAGARDILLYLRARSGPLALLLERRRRAGRPALVLLPTLESLDTEQRAEHGPGSHVEVDALADLVTIRDGSLTLAPRLRTVHARATDAPLSIGRQRESATVVETGIEASKARPVLTLVIDAPRTEQRMGVLANGVRLELQDARFALLIKLVSAHLRTPEGWVEYRDAGVLRSRTPISRVCTDFARFVPDAFRIIVTDRRGSCRLNPAVVVERVDWANVAAHPQIAVKNLAKLHLKA